MKKYITALVAVAMVLASIPLSLDAKRKSADLVEKYPALAPYFSTPSTESIRPDEQGFIRRWLLLEPISKPNRGIQSLWTATSERIWTQDGTRAISRCQKMDRKSRILP